MEIQPNLPTKGSRIVVAMSGGVDSAVSAGWLKEMGYDVIGISLQLHDMTENLDNKYGSCCSLSDISDARRVAEKIGIPFYVTDMETEFNEAVIDDFVQEYLKGRTPNPCVRCNEKVKFHKLMDWALDLGAEYLATGHYAQNRFNPDTNKHELLRGSDPDKDQSYFLFTLQQQDLAKTLFPVGNMMKSKVRELAQRLELGVADKPDSQEICFVQNKSYREFIEERVPAALRKPGPIIHLSGEIMGEHEGLHHFTIGQRKGLKVNSSEPLFVLSINAQTNEVFVGPETALFQKTCTLSNVNWIMEPELDTNPQLTAKIRYRAKEAKVSLTPLLDGRVEVTFDQAQRAITPGQAVVLYRGDAVVGGGWIEDV